MYLDTARQGIAKLPKEVQPYFLAPLIAKASIHANTSGVFKGFYKSQHGIGQYGGSGRDALPEKRSKQFSRFLLSRFLT